jgi:hypothetical protein
VGVLLHMFDSLCVFSSDLPGFDPVTLNGMILYYHLMTKWSGLGGSTKLSRMGLSQCASVPYGVAAPGAGLKMRNACTSVA